MARNDIMARMRIVKVRAVSRFSCDLGQSDFGYPEETYNVSDPEIALQEYFDKHWERFCDPDLKIQITETIFSTEREEDQAVMATWFNNAKSRKKKCLAEQKLAQIEKLKKEIEELS